MSRKNKSKYFKDEEEDSGSEGSAGFKSDDDSDGLDTSNIISEGRSRRSRAKVNYSKFFDGDDDDSQSDKDAKPDSSDASDDSDAAPKSKRKKRPKSKASTTKKPSLKDRLKQLRKGSADKDKKVPTSKPKRKRAKIVSSEEDVSDASSDADSTPPPKKKRPTKKKAKKIESSDEESAPESATKTKAAPSKPASKKRSLPSFLKKAKEAPKKKPVKRAKTTTTKKKAATPKKKSGGKKEMPPGSDDPHENFNEQITSILNDIGKNEKNEGNQYKGLVYFKAARTLKKLPFAVKSGKEAAQYPGIGRSIAEKIDEILKTGGLKKLEEAKERPRTKALNELTKVHGIGPKHAQQMFDDHNIKGLDDLSKNQHLLNDAQKVGLKYVKDLQQPIPREECTQLFEFIKTVAAEVDKDVLVVICGSYRRGKEQSNDVDFILTKKDWKHDGDRPASINEIVMRLHAKKFLVADLAHGEHKYMGVCRLPDPDAVKKEEESKKAEPAKPKAPLKQRAPTKIAMPDLDSDSDDESGDTPATATNIFLHPVAEDDKPKAAVEDIPLNAGQTEVPVEEDKSGHLARRIDLRFFPYDQYLAALLYFTGSDQFNRSMRLKAKEKGYILNEYGIYQADEDGKKVRGRPAEPVESEKDFFKLLDMDYVEPQNR